MNRLFKIILPMSVVCVSTALIIGANNSNSNNLQDSQKAEIKTGSIIVPGVVDSEVEVGYYTAPEVLPIARVRKVLVQPGQLVKANDPLLEFDDTEYLSKFTVAEKAVALANIDVKIAKQKRDQYYPLEKSGQEEALKKAQSELDYAERTKSVVYDSVKKNYEAYTDKKPLFEDFLKTSAEYTMAVGAIESKKLALAGENLKKQALEINSYELLVEKAQAELARLESMRDLQKALLDACILRSGVEGKIARISVAAGSNVSPQMQKPSIIIVPSGNRVIRAEVSPEFASKITGLKGKKVIIYDNDNDKLKYEGELDIIGEAFLPPRFAPLDIMKMNANRVLECTIRVLNPAPANQPELRVGQSVRVGF